MTPFFFGTSARRLFGIYTPALGGGAEVRAAVVCHPLGQEYLRAHRSTRLLATQLARAGIHVLRFDYYGTGDSGGDFAEGDLAGWRDDVETAVEELKEMVGAHQIGLAGLRLGGTLAASVAARRDDVHRLALWDPIVDGREYLRALAALSPGTAPGGALEVEGFVLPERLARELEAEALDALVPSLPARTLVVASDPAPLRGTVRSSLAEHPGGAIVVEEIPGPRPWVEDQSSGIGAVPAALLQRVVEWWGGTDARVP